MHLEAKSLRRRPRTPRRLAHEPLESRLLLAQTTGLFFHDPGTSDDLTLFSPNTSNNTYLIDKDGNLVHQWNTTTNPGLLGYLLDDGSLLRAAAPHGQTGNGSIVAAGSGGLIERYNWEGQKTWEFSYDSPTHLQHHDIEPLPNGNILLIAWDLKSEAEATQAGRDPDLPGPGYLYPDSIVEVHPDLVSGGGTIVWQWHLWDHLVQDQFPTKSNYQADGVAAHPELVNINYVSDAAAGGGAREDWTHANGVDYNPDLDEIVLSSREFSEFWIIDHSTTTAEAASHTGGLRGHGGDLLYRWGNPQAYGRGTASDRQFYFQHDPKWIEDGLPGEGHITVFNNGYFGPANPNVSSVDEIALPLLPDGNYTLDAGQAYGPAAPLWTYTGPVEDFSPIISGAQRLANGNTLVTYGVKGIFTEVTPDGQEVWKYVNPFTGGGTLGPDSPIPNLGIQIPLLDSLLVNFTFRAIDYTPDYTDLFAPPLRITELMYDPPAPSPDSPYHASEFEYIEVQNVASYPIELGGMQLFAGINYTFPDATLAPGEFGVVVENRDAFQSRYGAGINVLGEYSGKLLDAGETIGLRDKFGNLIQSFDYHNAWYPSTAGGGRSLVIVDSASEQSTWGQQASWRASTNMLGSPGAADPPPPGLSVQDFGPIVTGRRLFYNNSGYDDAFGDDNSAIASDKMAYIPSGANTVGQQNVSSYTKGINGIMVDLTRMHGPITAADFTVKMSQQNLNALDTNPSAWVPAPSFTVTSLGNFGGADRYELIWPDGAITNRYVEVITEGNDALGGHNTNTGLSSSDFFFFGNMVGESFNTAIYDGFFAVDSSDETAARFNAGFFGDISFIENPFDYNRDFSVDAVDQIIARNNGNFMLFFSTTIPPNAPSGGDGTGSAVASALAVRTEPAATTAAALDVLPPSTARPPAARVAIDHYWGELGAATDPYADELVGSLEAAEPLAVDEGVAH